MASDLISRKELNEAIRNDAPRYVPLWVYETIKKQPTVDAVEVVRCKDCKNRGTEDCAMYYECDCGEQHTWENDSDFCSWGVKMDGGDK